MNTWTIGSDKKEEKDSCCCCHHGKQELTVSSRGGLVRSWTIHQGDRTIDVIDGFRSDEENADGSGAYMAVLAPWSNRIRNGQFDFQGKHYDPRKSTAPDALHGLVRQAEFTLTHQDDTSVTLSTTTKPIDGYPWVADVEVTYTLDKKDDSTYRLSMHLVTTNKSDTDAPMTLGWHPYIRYQGGGAPEAKVAIPSATMVDFEDILVPLPGEKAYRTVERKDGYHVIEAPKNLDNAFTQLYVDDNHCATAKLTHPNGDETDVTLVVPKKVQLDMSQGDNGVTPRGVGILHFFTGEPLPLRACESMAIEPCLTVTDAFNREECREFITIKPGQSQVLDASITYHIKK